MAANKKIAFSTGLKMGIPIGLGYFVVSLALGISAKNAGLSAFQAGVAGVFLTASAGEYALFTLISSSGGLFEVAIMQFIVNARYLLMSCALSQKLSPQTKLYHKFLIGLSITDEMFGVSVSRPEKITPFFYFGMMTVAIPCWSIGSAIGVTMGNILPGIAVNALSVSLYGMFFAVIIPAARKSRIILITVLISFAFSFICSSVPFLSEIPEGTRIIILTVIIASVAALLFPVCDEKEEI